MQRLAFVVKNGVDPSGPLSLLLRDYDGNERVVKIHDGFCNKTAYLDPMTDSVSMKVLGMESIEALSRSMQIRAVTKRN